MAHTSIVSNNNEDAWRSLLHAAAGHLAPAGEEQELLTSPIQAHAAAALDGGRPQAVLASGPMHPGSSSAATASRSPSDSSQHSLQVETCSSPPPEQLLRGAERAVSMRLLPPLLLLVIISYLDRTALAFASIQMSQDLNLSSSMYGLGAGAFFLAYAAGQLPSNFLLLRFGGPVWLALICITWGVAASAMALVRGPVSFVLLRMLLGLAESGAFPGTWYYISCFYAANRTSVPYAVVETGITVSQVVAAPIAAGLLLLDGKLGLQGWQWLFMIEGIPAVLLGSFMTFWLPASVQTATFLTEPQRWALLKAVNIAAAPAGADPQLEPPGSQPLSDASSSVDVAIEVEAPHVSCKESEVAQLLHRGVGKQSQSAAVDAGAACCPAASRWARAGCPAPAAGSGVGSSGSSMSSAPSWRSVLAVARNRVVLYAGSWRILHDIAGNGVLYWTPKIVQVLLLAAAARAAQGGAGAAQGAAAGPSSPGVAVVLFSAIPYAAASLVHLLNAWHAQRVGEVRLHISLTWLVGAVALLVLPMAASGALSGSGSSGGGVSTAVSVSAFLLLTVAHIGVNGANGLQTGLVAGCLCAEQKALGLAMYNTIACMGSLTGPLLIGVIHDATHGYSVAMVVLGCSLAGAAFMVYRFKGVPA